MALTTPPSRTALIRRVLWITLALNALVAAAKLATGLSTGVLSLVADGVHSLLDGGSNIIGLLAIAAARRPPDADHPYGHRKLETVAAMAIGGMLIVACWEMAASLWGRLLEGAPAGRAGLLGFSVMGFTMAVNAFVSWYEAREGRRLGSEFLIADAAHTRSDLLVSLSVLLALAATRLGWGWADLAATAFIIAWILRLAWQVVRPALVTLADEARLDPAAIERVARSIPGVREVHFIRSRGHHDAVFVDLHFQVQPTMPVEQAHVLAHRVETALRDAFPNVMDVVTHVEPLGDPPERLDEHHTADLP